MAAVAGAKGLPPPRSDPEAGGGTGSGPATGFVDLGTGGGVPALVLLDEWPSATALLVEAAQRRAAFLRRAIADLGWSGRAQVLEGRAEVVGRRPDLRAALSLATARSFGPPAVTAECAAPLLRPGGRLLVSEPPEGPDRWPAEELAGLGMRPGPRLEADGYHFQLVEQVGVCPERYPRRVGVPARRPLF